MMSLVKDDDERGKQLLMTPSELSDSPSAAHRYCSYPAPLAKYEDVVRDPKLFMDTLEKLHATMRTKFMIPIIGGKDLDLHRLFVEVTSRGGLEKVISDRKWRDVASVFNFPSTATNASYISRKYYASLLKHYEQIYFFGSKGWNCTPAGPLPSDGTALPPHGLTSFRLPDFETQASSRKRRRIAESLPSRASLASSTGYPVVGVIDGKFEYGYFVTVTVGAEKLQGVLYHTLEQSNAQLQQCTAIANSGTGANDKMSAPRRRRRRKKSEIRKRDPFHPKPNRSGYNFFFAEQHARLKPLHPGKDREISKMIGDLWNKLTEDQRAIYQEKGVKDKERYKSEMEEYRERLKNGLIIRNAVPLQQRIAAPELETMVNREIRLDMEQSGSPGTARIETTSGNSESVEVMVSDKGSDSEKFLQEAGTAGEPILGPSIHHNGFKLLENLDCAKEKMTQNQ